MYNFDTYDESNFLKWSTEYKPCPFCGKENGLLIDKDETPGFRGTEEILVCKECIEKGEKI